MKQTKGLFFILLLFCTCSGAPEENAVETEFTDTVTANEHLVASADSSWMVYDGSQYSDNFLEGLKEHSSHYNIKVYRDFFLLGNDSIWPPNDLVVDSFYTLISTANNKTLKVELRRKNNTDVNYHILVLENMEYTLLSEYGTVKLYPSFYLAAEAEEDESGNGYLCTPYGNEGSENCFSICIGRSDDNRLMVQIESSCKEHQYLEGFKLPVEVSKKEFYKRIVIVKDSAEYSQEFLNGWKRSHTIDEIVEMRKDYLLIRSKDTFAFPEQIGRGKRYMYEAIKNDTIQQLVLTRKNTTALHYQISLTTKGKQLWGEQGEVHFDPAHLMTAIDGHCWFYYKSLANDYQKTCNLRICVDGVYSEENAQFEYLECDGVSRKYYFKLKSID